MTLFPYSVVLDNIRSALNVGAIFRTCDAAGVQKLFLCGITPYPPHNRIPKTALGAEQTVKWERAANTVDLVKSLQGAGQKIYVVEQTPSSKSYSEIDFSPNCVFVFGHEITGVNQEVISAADACIQLPMFGSKESLNVATSVGIICYHASLNFQRRGLGSSA